MHPPPWAGPLTHTRSNQDGVIDFQEFAIINHRYPLVFFPAFRMQLALQEFTLGTLYHVASPVR